MKTKEKQKVESRGLRKKPTKACNVIAREREKEAIELRKSGVTYQEIGNRLGISMQAAHQRVMSVLHEIAEVTGEKAEEVRELELQRLDAMLVGLWDKAKDGDPVAVDRAIRIMQRRADMLGIDAASKYEVMGKDGKPFRIEDARAHLDGVVARLASAIAPSGDTGKPKQ